jgi:hypothetical protein
MDAESKCDYNVVKLLFVNKIDLIAKNLLDIYKISVSKMYNFLYNLKVSRI